MSAASSRASCLLVLCCLAKPSCQPCAPRLKVVTIADRSSSTLPCSTQAAPPPPDPTVPPAQRPTMLGKAWAAALPQLPPGVRLRPGRPEDAPLLSKAVLREKMNPLGLKPERFTVAEREGSGAVVGFGQASRPLAECCASGCCPSGCAGPGGCVTRARRARPSRPRGGPCCPGGALQRLPPGSSSLDPGPASSPAQVLPPSAGQASGRRRGPGAGFPGGGGG